MHSRTKREFCTFSKQKPINQRERRRRRKTMKTIYDKRQNTNNAHCRRPSHKYHSSVFNIIICCYAKNIYIQFRAASKGSLHAHPQTHIHTEIACINRSSIAYVIFMCVAQKHENGKFLEIRWKRARDKTKEFLCICVCVCTSIFDKCHGNTQMKLTIKT